MVYVAEAERCGDGECQMRDRERLSVGRGVGGAPLDFAGVSRASLEN